MAHMSQWYAKSLSPQIIILTTQRTTRTPSLPPSFLVFFFLGICFKGFFFLGFLTGLVLRNEGRVEFYTFLILGSLLHES